MTDITNSLNTKEIDKKVSDDYSDKNNTQKPDYNGFNPIVPEETKYYKSQKIRSRTIKIKLG